VLEHDEVAADRQLVGMKLLTSVDIGDHPATMTEHGLVGVAPMDAGGRFRRS